MKNHAVVTKGFQILRDTLAPYIARELTLEFGKNNWWRDGVIEALYDEQKKAHLPNSGKYTDLTASLDIAICLLLFADIHWRIFNKKLSVDYRTWANELKSYRNKKAHIGGKDFSDDDTWRALDTMQRLVEPINSEASKKILDLRNSISISDSPHRHDVVQLSSDIVQGKDKKAKPVNIDIDYMEMWNDICFHVNKNHSAPEKDFQKTIEFMFEKLGWSLYKGEILTGVKIPIGSSGNLKPDIIIKDNDKEVLVIELKRAGANLSVRDGEQLISYMRFAKLPFGVLIGSSLQLFCDFPDDSNFPVKVCDILFLEDSEEGKECIELLSKIEFSFEKLQGFCIKCISNPNLYNIKEQPHANNREKNNTSAHIQELFEQTRNFIMSLDKNNMDEEVINEMKLLYYYASRWIATILIRQNWLKIHIGVEPKNLSVQELGDPFITTYLPRDTTQISVTVRNGADLDKAKLFIKRAHLGN